jgi:serine protease Do
MRRAAVILLWSSLAASVAACGGAKPSARSTPAAPTAGATMTPAQIAAKSTPSVVTIRTESSLGSGFVVRQDGWVATNMHVVVGGPRVTVTLRDDRELEVVEVLAASPEHDLALLRVEAKGLPVLALGDSDAMHPGDPVVAIGHPLGLEDTVSNGLVSARRKVGDGFEVLQVSAPIAPGSSGGPLINEHGEVIGIATAVLEGGQNLNFAVPIRYLRAMMRNPSPMAFSEFATLIAQLRAASAPKVDRKVPKLPVSILDGCSQDAQRLIVGMLGDAIEAGAPLYNAGKPAGCYHVYDGAATDLARKLPAACKGPAHALADAQKKAATLGDPGTQAWALRDEFDGLLDVVARKQEQ